MEETRLRNKKKNWTRNQRNKKIKLILLINN